MTEQLQLVPDERAEGLQESVALDTLPPNANLISPAPDATFLATVRAFGVLQPVLLIGQEEAVYRGVDGPVYESYIVADGRRRIKAARIAELEEVPAIIFPPTWTVADVLSIVANQQRSENPASDLRAIKGMMKRGASEEEICAATGQPKGTLHKRLKLVNLRDELLQGYEAGQLKTSTAEAAAKLSQARQEPLVALLLEKGKLKYNDVAAATRVGAQQSVAALPDMLFTTPELTAPSVGSLETRIAAMPTVRHRVLAYMLLAADEMAEEYKDSEARHHLRRAYEVLEREKAVTT